MRSMFGVPRNIAFDAESREGGLWVAVSVRTNIFCVQPVACLRLLSVTLLCLRVCLFAAV